MQSLAVVSAKGGVGKTTVALNLSYAMAQRGWRTLVVDLDAQGGLGLSILGAQNWELGLADYVAGNVALDQIARETRQRNLGVLPRGTVRASEHDAWALSLADGTVLGRLLADASADWDLVVLDTPAGLHGASCGAMRAAGAALVPLQAEPLALRALPQLLEALADLRSSGAATEEMWFVPTMVQSRQGDSLAVVHESWRLLPAERVLETTIPRDEVILRASAEGVPVALLSRRPPPVATVFDRLAAELETKLDLVDHEEDEGAISLVD